VTLSEVIVDDRQADVWPSNIPFLHNESRVLKGFDID
jgi:hypothetical protein